MKGNFSAFALIGIILTLYSAVLALPANKPRAANSGSAKVAVSCSGDDSVGSRLCLAVKEKIRSSPAFHLVDECQVSVLCISLISIDVDAGVKGMEEGYESSASVVITYGPFYFLAHVLYTVGRHRVDSQADEIIATADNTLSDFNHNW